jgi:GcrA cell cycle regulator
MRTDFWTKERITTLEMLWGQGKSAGTIAKALGGISRSAVLGKIFRLRLGGAPKSASKPKAKTQQFTPQCTQQRAAKQAPQKPQAKRHGPERRRGAELATSTPPARASKRKSLFELTNRCCRWPHGSPGTKNFFFCGAPGADVESGVPYCAAHMKRAYIVPPDAAGNAHARMQISERTRDRDAGLHARTRFPFIAA